MGVIKNDRYQLGKITTDSGCLNLEMISDPLCTAEEEEQSTKSRGLRNSPSLGITRASDGRGDQRRSREE